MKPPKKSKHRSRNRWNWSYAHCKKKIHITIDTSHWSVWHPKWCGPVPERKHHPKITQMRMTWFYSMCFCLFSAWSRDIWEPSPTVFLTTWNTHVKLRESKWMCAGSQKIFACMCIAWYALHIGTCRLWGSAFRTHALHRPFVGSSVHTMNRELTKTISARLHDFKVSICKSLWAIECIQCYMIWFG